MHNKIQFASIKVIDFTKGVSLSHRLNQQNEAIVQRLSRTARFCPGCGSIVEQAVINERGHRRHRILPMDDDTLNMLREYITCGGPVRRNGHYLLFGLTREYAWLLVKNCASRAGLEKLVNRETGEVRGISPHRLRDAFTVHAIKLDGSTDGLRLLQEHLGRQSIATTMKYRKVLGDEHRDWYQRLWNTSTVPV